MKKKSESNKNKVRFEIEFFEKLIEQKPDFVDVLLPLAEVYTQVGDYEKGLVLDKRLSELRPDDAIVHYNLACSFSLTGKIDEAIKALKKAVDLGYDDFDYMSVDQDLLNVRNNKLYKEMFTEWAKKKRG